jgi:hypothetical protein
MSVVNDRERYEQGEKGSHKNIDSSMSTPFHFYPFT